MGTLLLISGNKKKVPINITSTDTKIIFNSKLRPYKGQKALYSKLKRKHIVYKQRK